MNEDKIKEILIKTLEDNGIELWETGYNKFNSDPIPLARIDKDAECGFLAKQIDDLYKPPEEVLLSDEEILGDTVDETARKLAIDDGWVGFNKYPDNLANKNDCIWKRNGNEHRVEYTQIVLGLLKDKRKTADTATAKAKLFYDAEKEKEIQKEWNRNDANILAISKYKEQKEKEIRGIFEELERTYEPTVPMTMDYIEYRKIKAKYLGGK